jgi:hypothetical protein
VTFPTASVISWPNASIGSSSSTIFTFRFHPSLGSKLTNVSGGILRTTFVVSASGCSFGTRTTKRENDPEIASFGWTVT